jgi:hypothetical protein
VLSFAAGVDVDRAWRLNVWIDNRQVYERLIQGDEDGRRWEEIEIDLEAYAGREVQLRLYQQVLAHNITSPGTAYWRGLTLSSRSPKNHTKIK